MESKVVLEVVVSREEEIDELIQNPEVYGEAVKCLISHLRVPSYNKNIEWEDEDFKVIFLL